MKKEVSKKSSAKSTTKASVKKPVVKAPVKKEVSSKKSTTKKIEVKKPTTTKKEVKKVEQPKKFVVRKFIDDTATQPKEEVKQEETKKEEVKVENSTNTTNDVLAVEMKGITKKFGEIYANKNVDLSIRKGEIHALLGENGAGKSTIMSVLFGLYTPDEGTIKINGKEEIIKDPNDATKLKIGMVHQHFKLVEVFTILDNIIMGREFPKTDHFENAQKRRDKDVTRLYVIAGLLRAYEHFDDVIKIIHDAQSPTAVRVDLYNKYQLTTSQIDALLATPLSELTILRQESLKKEAIKLRERVIAVGTKREKIFTKAWWGIVFAFAKFVDFFNKKTNVIDKDKAAFQITAIAKKYGLEVDLDCKVEDATVGMQQRTEILKMLYRDSDILIFDEPTAVLTPQEIEGLLQIMRNLKAEGKTIILITHKLNEIMAVADRVTVLRRGEVIGTVNVKDTNATKLSEMMVGHHVVEAVNTLPYNKDAETLLKVRNVCMYDSVKGKNSLTDVSFDVKKGEIVTIAGIDGNGQSELVYALSGLERLKSGTVEMKGHKFKNGSVKERNKYGLSHIPEDRHKHGLVLDYRLEENLVLRDFNDKRFSKFGFIRKGNVRGNANELISGHDIRSASGAVSSARSMSGGNQQKAIIAREIERHPELLIAVQPTRGVDVGAISQIHGRLLEEKKKGVSVLLVSFELDEVFSLSDRILVMYEGEIVGEFDPKKVTRQELGLYMSGAKKDYKFVEGGK